MSFRFNASLSKLFLEQVGFVSIYALETTRTPTFPARKLSQLLTLCPTLTHFEIIERAFVRNLNLLCTAPDSSGPSKNQTTQPGKDESIQYPYTPSFDQHLRFLVKAIVYNKVSGSTSTSTAVSGISLASQ
jgi:hypothetical protein